MADRRRRRKLASNDDSDDCSDESDDEQSGLRKSLTGSDGGDSEYESADEEELGDEEEEDDDDLILMPDGIGVPGEDNKPLDDDEDRKNPQYIPKKGTFYEHDDRTAEDDAEKPTTEEPVAKKEVAKKKVWKEDDRWNHDKFNEYDQAPKSREELIAIYGYDIRNEEGPPRARRRRRYGRGPNKYTRNWEDLDAYAKPTRGGTVRGGLGRGNKPWTGSRKTLENDEEFPALNSPMQNQKHKKEDPLVERTVANSESPRVDHQKPILDDQILGDHDIHKQQQHHSPQQHQHQKNSVASPQLQDVRAEMPGRGRGGRGRGRGAGRGSNKHEERIGHSYQDGRPGGRGGRGAHQQKPPQQHQSHGPRDMEELTTDMKNINVSAQNREEQQFRGKNRGGGNSENRRNMVPPRLQDSAAAAAGAQGRGNRGGNASPGGDGSASRPKRYSSQRQRSIPDQPVPPFQQQPNYIDPSMESGYQGGVYEGGNGDPSTSHSVTAPHSQMPLGGAPPSFVPPAFTSPPTFPPEPFLGRPPAPRPFPPVTQSPHLYGPPVAPPVAGPPVGAPPPLGAPPVGAPPVPGPPVTGPPFLPPENMINYGAHPGPHPGPLPGTAPLAGPHPPQFPPFQGFTPGPVSQPGEIYSNGVTYYNTESQQHHPRSTLPLQKRPKAAIPIVPPPERESRKDGGMSQETGFRQEEQFSDQLEQEQRFEVPQQEAEAPQETQQEPDKINEESTHVENTEPIVSVKPSEEQQKNTKEENIEENVDNHLKDNTPEVATTPSQGTEEKPIVDAPQSATEKEVSSPESKSTEQSTLSEEVRTPPPVSETPDTAVAAS